MKLNQNESTEITHKIIEACWADSNFKQAFIEDPVNATQQYLGFGLGFPEGMQLKIVDQSDNNSIYFNIPAEPDLDSLQLTDEELESISGGGTITIVPIAVGLYSLYKLGQKHACKNKS